MKEPQTNTKKLSGGKTRRHHAFILGVFILLMFFAAASIPFAYESTTIWYKFGVKRWLLRSGQVIGLVTVVLFGLQLLLAARFGVIDRIVGINKIYGLHRQIGLGIILFALTHALLILIPEGMNNLPIGWKYWPEMIGAFALSLLCLHIVSALYRSNFKISIQRWKRFHRLIGYSIFLLLNIHVLFVSTSFAQGPPRYALLIFSGSVLMALLLQKTYFSPRRSS